MLIQAFKMTKTPRCILNNFWKWKNILQVIPISSWIRPVGLWTDRYTARTPPNSARFDGHRMDIPVSAPVSCTSKLRLKYHGIVGDPSATGSFSCVLQPGCEAPWSSVPRTSSRTPCKSAHKWGFCSCNLLGCSLWASYFAWSAYRFCSCWSHRPVWSCQDSADWPPLSRT